MLLGQVSRRQRQEVAIAGRGLRRLESQDAGFALDFWRQLLPDLPKGCGGNAEGRTDALQRFGLVEAAGGADVGLPHDIIGRLYDHGEHCLRDRLRQCRHITVVVQPNRHLDGLRQPPPLGQLLAQQGVVGPEAFILDHVEAGLCRLGLLRDGGQALGHGVL